MTPLIDSLRDTWGNEWSLNDRITWRIPGVVSWPGKIIAVFPGTSLVRVELSTGAHETVSTRDLTLVRRRHRDEVPCAVKEQAEAQGKCWYCGRALHPDKVCPACDEPRLTAAEWGLRTEPR